MTSALRTVDRAGFRVPRGRARPTLQFWPTGEFLRRTEPGRADGQRPHLDACAGGWVLAFADRIGRVKPAWTFAVPGVSSISLDLHKHAYTPQGASILLHRTPADRRPTYFSSAQWPGYTMVNAVQQSSKADGPLAGAWAAVKAIGEQGYLTLARDWHEAVDQIVVGLDEVDGVELVVHPDSTLITLRTDGTSDVFTIADEMAERGWHVPPQMSWGRETPTLHLSVSASTLPHVQECLQVLKDSVAAAREAGPAQVDRGVLGLLSRLDPDRLTDAEFDDLLVTAGLAGGAGVVGLPKRMASVSALVNAASPALREALLGAYADRLYRPVRTR